jgi:hypothetical protein
VGVLAGIPQHLGRDGSLPPICQLVLFVSKDIAIGLEEESKREAFQLKDSGGLPSIEKVHNIETEIFLKPFYVVVGAMENLDFGWIGKYRSKIRPNQLSQFQCINDEISKPSRHLHQTCESLIRSKIMMFQINSNLSHALITQMIPHLSHLLFILHI